MLFQMFFLVFVTVVLKAPLNANQQTFIIFQLQFQLFCLCPKLIKLKTEWEIIMSIMMSQNTVIGTPMTTPNAHYQHL